MSEAKTVDRSSPDSAEQLWDEYCDQLEHEPSAQGAISFAFGRLCQPVIDDLCGGPIATSDAHTEQRCFKPAIPTAADAVAEMYKTARKVREVPADPWYGTFRSPDGAATPRAYRLDHPTHGIELSIHQPDEDWAKRGWTVTPLYADAAQAESRPETARASDTPMLADVAQIISEGWQTGKSSAEVAEAVLREFGNPAAATTARPDSIYSQFHLDNWTDDDFSKHAAATRKTLAWLLKLEASLQARHAAQPAKEPGK